MNNPIGIYGAGGHSRVIASILYANGLSAMGMFDDSYNGQEIIQGIPVLGKFKRILEYSGIISEVYIAIGDNGDRKAAFEFLFGSGFELPLLTHPSAVIEKRALIGLGSVICIGAIIGSEVSIGRGTIINTGCSVDHESFVGDFTHLAPRVVVAGRTRIGNNTFVGMNTCIGDKVTIGNNVIVGAGSVVLRDVLDGEKIKGIHS